MDIVTTLAALTELIKVGGIPAAIMGLVVYSWLQDRKKNPETTDTFKTDVLVRLAVLESDIKRILNGDK